MRKYVQAVALAMALVSAAACGGGHDADLSIGIKRVALNLVFAKEELAKPVKPKVIIKLLPPIQGLNSAADLPKFETPPATSPPQPFVPLFPDCGTAPAGSSPKTGAAFSALLPPTKGDYLRHNKGTIKITGAIPLTFPFPPISQDRYSKYKKTVEPGAVQSLPPIVEYEYTHQRILAPGFSVTDTLLLTEDNIQLVKRVSEAQGVKQVFTPTPPVNIYVFGDEGSLWASAGMDTETNTSMAVTGKIVNRELVDVCGQMVDTWHAEVTETFVNLDTHEVSGTDAQKPNIYNVAPQYGGLFVREKVSSTQTTEAPDGTPVVLAFDYVSTIDDIKPGVGLYP